MNFNSLIIRSFSKNFINTIVLLIFSSLVVSCGNPGNNVQSVDQTNPSNSAPTNLNEQNQNNKRSTIDKTNQSQNENSVKATSQDKSSTNTLAQTDQTQEVASKRPQVGTVKEMAQGDIMCYVTLTDKAGKDHNLGAAFEICGKSEEVLNKEVSLVYEKAAVNDCEGIEACGKTRQEWLITKIEVSR